MTRQSPECYVTDPFSSNPPPHSQARPSLSISASQSPQMNPKDYPCFKCKRIGHWYRDCPNKTPKKSQSSSPGSTSSFSMNGSDLPLVRCPCGWGCRVITSQTEKNPGRKFYTCPDRSPGNNCHFFEWSDAIVARYKPPLCPCGAGKCSLNKVSSGPDRDRWYFACRIKKSHGACQFFQWADSEANSWRNMCVEKDKGNSVCKSLFPNHPVLIENNEICNEEMVESFEKDEMAVRELVIQEVESWDPAAGKAFRVPSPISQSEIHCLETESSCQVPAAEHTISKGISDSFVPVIKDVSGIEGVILLGDSSLNEESDTPHSPREAAEHPKSVFQEPSRIKILVQKNDIARSALTKYGQGLLDILQSMHHTQHETMMKVAEASFDTLRHLSVDHESFSKAVRDYIHCQSRLAGIERSMGKDFSSEEFMAQYNDKKVQFDSVSQLHLKAVSANKASENHLKSLRRKVEHVKDELLQLEKQLFLCEAETLESETHVAQIFNDMSELGRSLDDTCTKVEESFKLEDERDLILGAADAALENAMIQLLERDNDTSKI